MRIDLVLGIATLASSAVVAADRPVARVAGTPLCPKHGTVQVSSGKAFGARPLGQQPGALHMKAVVRTIDGCSQPIVLSRDIGPRRP